jgi:hypothetical protein
VPNIRYERCVETVALDFIMFSVVRIWWINFESPDISDRATTASADGLLHKCKVESKHVTDSEIGLIYGQSRGS